MAKAVGKKSYRDDQLERTRRVQKVGGSSLSVTLPKNWIEEINLKPGDILTFREMSGGRLELAKETQGDYSPEAQKTVHIDMDSEEPNMLTRLIVGSYVAGHDNVIIKSKDQFTEAQKEEAARAVKRMLGLSLVEQSGNTMEFQNFIDPIKHRLDHIMSRVIGVLTAEIIGCRKGFAESNKEPIEAVADLEDEVDSFYLLMIRQLLLSSENYRLAKGLGIENHRYQMGFRLVIKELERFADLIFSISRELWLLVDSNAKLPDELRKDIIEMLTNLNRFLLETYNAFRELPLLNINRVINNINAWLDELTTNVSAPSTLLDTKTANTVQRLVTRCIEATRLLIVVNQVAFDSSMERNRIMDNGSHINVNHRG